MKSLSGGEAWIAALAAAVVAGCSGGGESGHKHDDHKPEADKAKDPVCGMTIAKGALKTDWDKADWYFCSDSCKEKFTKEPVKYAKACACASTMKNCLCTHCEGKRDPCDCGQEK